MNLEEKRKKVLEAFKGLFDDSVSIQRKLDKLAISKKEVLEKLHGVKATHEEETLMEEKSKLMNDISKMKFKELEGIVSKLDETTIDSILSSI